MLFGSVARGQANERSDIDLIAIYDDLDYNRRGEIADPLTAAAVEAAGFPVDVLVDRRQGNVDWGKEMVMPDSDYQEGLYRLRHLANALATLESKMRPGGLETLNTNLGNRELAGIAQIGRMLALGGSAHAAVETAVEALIHVTAATRDEVWGHRIEELCGELPDGTRSDVERMLHPLSGRTITPWHWYERYHRRGKDPDPTSEVVTTLIGSACRVATYAAGHFGTEPVAELVHGNVAIVDDYLVS